MIKAVTRPPALTDKINLKESNTCQKSLLFPHMTDGTFRPAQLRRFIPDSLHVFCNAFEIVIIYIDDIFLRVGITGFCKFFSEDIQVKTPFSSCTAASSTSKHWTVHREDYLSILIMHCGFYNDVSVWTCMCVFLLRMLLGMFNGWEVVKRGIVTGHVGWKGGRTGSLLLLGIGKFRESWWGSALVIAAHVWITLRSTLFCR